MLDDATCATMPDDEGRPFVAVIYEEGSDVPHDWAWTWETGQTMALEGYRVVALADDGYMTKADAQALYDAERACFADCFGFSR